jgi:hypothetical protein
MAKNYQWYEIFSVMSEEGLRLVRSTVEVISMPIGQRVLSLIRIVLLGKGTHVGDVRPNESIIRPTYQHQEALPQYQ